MNYLAHAYFSFNHPEILVGNMISDFVKGKKKFDYPPAIQKGIMLHRMIDEYTDSHAATHAAKQFFKPAVATYCGAFMDVVYDHFLAIDKNEFPGDTLKEFTTSTYKSLENYIPLFPEKFARMFPYMKEQDWLYNYQFRWGIEKSFGGIVRRAAYLENSEEAFIAFNENYDELKKYADAFLPDIKKYTAEKLSMLLKN